MGPLDDWYWCQLPANGSQTERACLQSERLAAHGVQVRQSVQLVVIQVAVGSELCVDNLASQFRLHVWVLCKEMQCTCHSIRRGVHRREDDGPEDTVIIGMCTDLPRMRRETYDIWPRS